MESIFSQASNVFTIIKRWWFSVDNGLSLSWSSLWSLAITHYDETRAPFHCTDQETESQAGHTDTSDTVGTRNQGVSLPVSMPPCASKMTLS